MLSSVISYEAKLEETSRKVGRFPATRQGRNCNKNLPHLFRKCQRLLSFLLCPWADFIKVGRAQGVKRRTHPNLGENTIS
jgi:hypothetical protein